jgi:hypothetical protein
MPLLHVYGLTLQLGYNHKNCKIVLRELARSYLNISSMKILPSTILLITAISQYSFAGALFGPPPFTNGSPLQTGVQGTYQASAVGPNITGIIRFAYNSQGNPSALGFNDYIFFVNGTIVAGETEAAIMDDKIAGVLNQPNTPTTPPTDGYFDSLGGYFKAKIENNSPFYSFKGSGGLMVYEAVGDAAAISPVQKSFNVYGMRTSLNTAE